MRGGISAVGEEEGGEESGIDARAAMSLEVWAIVVFDDNDDDDEEGADMERGEGCWSPAHSWWEKAAVVGVLMGVLNWEEDGERMTGMEAERRRFERREEMNAASRGKSEDRCVSVK